MSGTAGFAGSAGRPPRRVDPTPVHTRRGTSEFSIGMLMISADPRDAVAALRPEPAPRGDGPVHPVDDIDRPARTPAPQPAFRTRVVGGRLEMRVTGDEGVPAG